MRAYNSLNCRLHTIFKHQILLIVTDIFRIQALHDFRIVQKAGNHGLALGDLAVQHGICLPDLFFHTLLFLIQQIIMGLVIRVDPQRDQRNAGC